MRNYSASKSSVDCPDLDDFLMLSNYIYKKEKEEVFAEELKEELRDMLKTNQKKFVARPLSRHYSPKSSVAGTQTPSSNLSDNAYCNKNLSVIYTNNRK